MSTPAAVKSHPPESSPASQVLESGEFPRSVNWNNPRVLAILETAAACFARGGFTATTLADIGKELGLRKSIVHYYFASKAALVHEVQSFAYGRYLEAIRKALSGSSGKPALKRLAEVLKEPSTLLHLHVELWSESRRDPELRNRAQVLDEEAERLLQAYFVERGRDAGEARELAALSLVVLSGMTAMGGGGSFEERADRAWSAFMGLIGEEDSVLSLERLNR